MHEICEAADCEICEERLRRANAGLDWSTIARKARAVREAAARLRKKIPGGTIGQA